MSTPSLNNGMFIRDTRYESTSNVDAYHLGALLKSGEPMDLGPVDMWAMFQKVEMPLFQFSSFGGKNIIPVKNLKGEYKWQVPVSQDLPYSTGDLNPGNAQKGWDGTTFQIKLNRKAFGHGDIISYDKYKGAELYITSADIIPAGDGAIYTVQLVNNDNTKFLDNKFLANGTKFFRKGSARSGEHGQKFADLTSNTSGFREFYNFVGGAEAHANFSISSKAEMMLRGGANADGTVNVTEMWRNFDKSLDPSINSLESMHALKGKDYIKKSMANGTLSRVFVTEMESACLTKVANDIETYLMWGQGGRIRQTDGPDDLRLSVGLWAQLDNSYKRIYNKSGFSLQLFKSEIFNFFNGKVEFKGPDPKRKLIIQTGMGGMRMVNEAIQREVAGSGLVVNASNIGAVTGSNPMELGFGYTYTSYIIPFLANCEFVLNPAFDNVHTNDIENPIIDGFPLSSYNFIIFDVTDNTNDNIFKLELDWDKDLKWFYQNGTMDYMGRNGHASTGLFSGYKVFMTQTMPAIWVKDPTKVLKIVMRNPITGGSF